MRRKAGLGRFDVSVFVNCPFDEAYRALLHAALFAIHDCGFAARTALEDVGSDETRLDKIVRIIGESRFSVHDISRVEVNADAPLPRFNMPFECGLSFGAARFGSAAGATGRDQLVLAAEKFQDRRTLSDLAGQDAAYHGNDVRELIRAVRGFLAAKAKQVLPPAVLVRGHGAIADRFDQFRRELPALARSAGIEPEEIVSLDYVPDWLMLAARWQATSTERIR